MTDEPLDPTLGVPGKEPSDPGAWPAGDADTRIGNYRILGVLGVGGMGTVYEAEQDRPRRIVALKVINPGLTSPQYLRRFELESEVLGRLDHPGIARVFEAGAADRGQGPQPWFAMELVRGQTLLDYAESHKLKTAERLELMEKICDAVHHAHQKGIIHRDLKPANILVDESGHPKVLDFGVARSTATDLTSGGATSVGDLIGTLPYMSPEQVTLDPSALDVRSDIYALGVVLYELLSGRLPYDVRGKVILEAMRVIAEDDPTPLSSINRMFRGDIETIVAKALEKDRELRYDSAAGLGADIRRHLDEQPITARPPNAAYQLRKFARRNRGLVAGVAAIFVVLVVGAGVSIWQAVRATRAERLATREVAKAAAVNDFLQSMLNAASPSESPGRDITVREMLDVAAARINESGAGDDNPEVIGSIQRTLGKVYGTIDQLDSAAVHLTSSLATLQAAGLGGTVQGNLTRLDLANLELDLGNVPEADGLVEAARKIAEGRRPRDPGEMAALRLPQASLRYRADSREEALRLRTEGLAFRRQDPKSRPEDVAGDLEGLAFYHSELRQYEPADSTAREALHILTRRFGENHSRWIVTATRLGDVQILAGNLAAADSTIRRALAAARRVYAGRDNRTVADVLWRLGRVLELRQDYAAADSVYRECLAMRLKILGPHHNDVAVAMASLAAVELVFGRVAEAERLYRQSLAIRIRKEGEGSAAVLASWNDMAHFYLSTGQRLRADSIFVASAPQWRRLPGNRASGEIYTLTAAAINRSAMGDLPTAEMWFRKALEVCRAVHGDDHLETAKCLDYLGTSIFRQGRADSAEILTRQALEIRRRRGPGTREHASSLVNVAFYVDARKDYAAAESLLVEALGIARNYDPEMLIDALSQLGRCYLFQEKWSQAEPALREAVTLQARQLRPDRAYALYNKTRLGRSLVGLKRYSEAESLLVPVVAELPGVGISPIRYTTAVGYLADYYEATGQPELAREWRAKVAAPAH